MNECTLMMIFVQVFSQWGFLGSYFMVQSKTRSLSIGVPYWLEGSVWWYCCGIIFKCYSWLLHAVTCTRCVLIRIHAYSYASTRYKLRTHTHLCVLIRIYEIRAAYSYAPMRTHTHPRYKSKRGRHYLTADCDGQTMYVRYICVSSGAPCAQPHKNPTHQKSKLP